MVVRGGVDFDALDGAPVDLIFLIAAPNTEDNVHLEVLSRLSMLLMDPKFSDSLKAAKTPEEFLTIIDNAEAAREAEDAAKNKASGNGYEILAVTASDLQCGIAIPSPIPVVDSSSRANTPLR
jgi:PTS system fructose-specific IIC component